MKKEEIRSVETIVKEEFGKLLFIIDAYLENNKKLYDEKVKGNKVGRDYVINNL